MKPQSVCPEKRKFPRINKRMVFKIESEEGPVARAETINLSCSGVYCKVSKHIPLMSNLRIVFALIYGNGLDGVEYVKCEGVVVRVEEVLPQSNGYHIAIFFNEIEDSERNKIFDFIEKHRNSDNEI